MDTQLHAYVTFRPIMVWCWE